MIRPVGLALAILLLLGLPQAAAGQSTADAYFHRAAQQYVDGNRAAARRTVERGLAEAPDDPRLQALREKLQQKGPSSAEQEGQQSSRQGPQGEGQTNASRGGQRNPQANQEEMRDRGGEQQREGEGRRSESGSDQQSASEQGASGQGREGERRAEASERDDPSGAARPGREGRLSRAQAERLLRALSVQERTLLREIRRQRSAEQRVEKDW